MGLFDIFKRAAQEAVSTAQDAAGEAVDAAEAVVDEVTSTPPPPAPPPTTIGFDGRIGQGTPVFTVGPPDLVFGDVQRSDSGPSGTIRLGPVELRADIDTILPGAMTAHGGTVVGGQGVTVGIDGPGIDAAFTGEQVMTVNPMVIGIVPEVGGAAFGAAGEVTVHPDEMPSFDPPAPPPTDHLELPAVPAPPMVDVVFDATDDAVGDVRGELQSTRATDWAMAPSAPAPIPIPYPNTDALLDMGDTGATVEQITPDEMVVDVPPPPPPPMPEPSDFEQDLQTIDDVADDLDIFD